MMLKMSCRDLGSADCDYVRMDEYLASPAARE